MLRSIRGIYQQNARHWVGDGFWVQSLFSHLGGHEAPSPFLLLDYAAPYHFDANEGKPRGVGQHPHKGFETVTIAYQGEVAHRDSSGGGGVIRAGDVQWMTAGAGIMHEEFHSPDFSRSGGEFEMVQLWVNLPAKDKLTQPRYQHLARENIAVVDLPDEAGSIRLIAGQWGDTLGAAQTFTEMNVWDGKLSAGKSTTLPIAAGHTASVIVLRGEIDFGNEQIAHAGQWVSFEVDGDEIFLQALEEDAAFLLLSGEPIDEPIVGYGPFVMNTEAEIRETLADFRSGKFGRIGVQS